MNIVHIVCTDNFAGVERHVLTLARAQRALGSTVTVIGGDGAVMRPSLTAGGVDWRPGGSVLAAIRSTAHLSRPTIVHTHMSAADIAGVIIAARFHVPVVSTRHFAAAHGRNVLNRAVMTLVRSRIRKQIAISTFVADAVEGASRVVHAGVAHVAERNLPREPLVVVVQRLEREKHTQTVLDAWASVAPQHPSWRLALLGDGSDRERLEVAAESLGVADSVSFEGFQSDTVGWLQRSSIMVASTPVEGYGLSAVEAMAAGTPVVAPASGGYLETVGAIDDPMLYLPGEAASLASVLDRLIRDRTGREAYGRRLRAYQQAHLTPERQASATLPVYEDAVG